MSEFSDNKILELFRNEDTRNYGFNLLIKKYQKKVYWQARRIVICHDDANDITQNVFIKIWKNLDTFREESLLFSWIYKITNNESLTFLKKKRSFLSVPFEGLENQLSDCLKEESILDTNSIQFKLQKAILKLPEKQKIVFNMRYYENLTYKEISQILGTSVGALKASYHIAIKKIEKYLKEN